jgi:hypothetical protein
MKNFDLRKFLVENKLTEQSKLISEVKYKSWSEIERTMKFPEGTEFYAYDNGQKWAEYPDGREVRLSGPRGADDKNSSDLSWEDFQKKFPEVKDDNLAGEVYSIMQEQNGFDDYDDEEIVSFMKAAATWEDAEDVADYFNEPASDIGKLIAGYYQEESGYEGFDDKWDNYLDYLFPQTERLGDDIDDYYIEDDDEPVVYKEEPVSFKDAFKKDPTELELGQGSIYAVATYSSTTGPNPEGFFLHVEIKRAMFFVQSAFQEEKKSNGKIGHFRDSSSVWDKGGSKDDYLSKAQQKEILNTDYQKDLLEPWSEGKLSNEDLYDKYMELYYPMYSLV